jgi:hypothetical protein
MVLGGRLPGRVGRRRNISQKRASAWRRPFSRPCSLGRWPTILTLIRRARLGPFRAAAVRVDPAAHGVVPGARATPGARGRRGADLSPEAAPAAPRPGRAGPGRATAAPARRGQATAAGLVVSLTDPMAKVPIDRATVRTARAAPRATGPTEPVRSARTGVRVDLLVAEPGAGEKAAGAEAEVVPPPGARRAEVGPGRGRLELEVSRGARRVPPGATGDQPAAREGGRAGPGRTGIGRFQQIDGIGTSGGAPAPGAVTTGLEMRGGAADHPAVDPTVDPRTGVDHREEDPRRGEPGGERVGDQAPPAAAVPGVRPVTAIGPAPHVPAGETATGPAPHVPAGETATGPARRAPRAAVERRDAPAVTAAAPETPTGAVMATGELPAGPAPTRGATTSGRQPDTRRRRSPAGAG